MRSRLLQGAPIRRRQRRRDAPELALIILELSVIMSQNISPVDWYVAS